jgi:peptidoglycan/LPS O-acetylase OafA/YrhL
MAIRVALDGPRPHYFAIDALRFLCALMVALHHLFFWSWASPYTTIGDAGQIFAGVAQFPSAVWWTWFGWIGVPIFFVISGFVITNSAIRVSPMQFWAARVLRLYPAVWVCATLSLVAQYFIGGISLPGLLGRYVKSMLLVPRPAFYWLDNAYWSLAVEIMFYALIFLILALKRASRIHGLAWLLTISSAVFCAFELAVELQFVSQPDVVLFWRAHQYSLFELLLRYGSQFAVGIWLWLAANERMTVASRTGLLLALVGSAIVAYNGALGMLAICPAASGQSPLVPVVILLAGILIVAGSSQGTGNRYAPTGPIRTALTYLGLISYPLYLIHDIVGVGTSRVLIEAGTNPWLSSFLVLSGLIAFCWLFCWKAEPVIRSHLRQVIAYAEVRFLRPRKALAFLFSPPDKSGASI